MIQYGWIMDSVQQNFASKYCLFINSRHCNRRFHDRKSLPQPILYWMKGMKNTLVKSMRQWTPSMYCIWQSAQHAIQWYNHLDLVCNNTQTELLGQRCQTMSTSSSVSTNTLKEKSSNWRREWIRSKHIRQRSCSRIWHGVVIVSSLTIDYIGSG